MTWPKLMTKKWSFPNSAFWRRREGKVISDIRAGILTASDRCSRGEREDGSGELLKALVETLPVEIGAYEIVSDDTEKIRRTLIRMADELHCRLILTTGGTGLSPRDNTPEATRAVIEKEI